MTAPKRPREASSTDGASPEDASSKIESPTASASGSQQASSFRNVSACNRCRLRKNRCDQRLPACASCEKAHVKCVGYDPITKREIPRRCVGDRPARRRVGEAMAALRCDLGGGGRQEEKIACALRASFAARLLLHAARPVAAGPANRQRKVGCDVC